MDLSAVILALTMVELHGPSGQPILVNPSEVTSMREPRAGAEGIHFPRGAHCLLVMANGNLITVRERCDEVRRKLEGGNG